MLSRQHYQAIADVLSETIEFYRGSDDSPRDVVDHVAADLADYFKHDNPRFDRARFLDAAGYTADAEDEDA